MDHRCESCGMPIETGRYCAHCVDENGRLQSFEERRDRLTAYIIARSPGMDRAAAASQAITHMRTMPAWRDRPEVQPDRP